MILKILSIIGLILLVLLLLCLFVLLLILFVPVRYKIKIKYDKELYFRCDITFLLRIFKLNVIYDKVLKYDFKILFFKVISYIDKEPSGEQIKRELKEKADKLDLKEKFTNTDNIIKFFSSDNLSKIKNFTMKILQIGQKVAPKKIKGRLRLGTGDAYTEGQWLSYFCLLYPLYAGNIEIIPEWKEKILELDVTAEGRITIFSVLVMFFKLMSGKKMWFRLVKHSGVRKKVA